jgi:predicted dehydrogenase
MVLYFEHGSIEAGLHAHSEVIVHLAQGIEIRTPLLKQHQVINTKGAFAAQLSDFAEAIASDGTCKIDGKAGLASVKLLEQCYAQKKSINDIQPAF